MVSYRFRLKVNFLNIKSATEGLERYTGFPIKRVNVTLESRRPHDESFSYNLCQRFYGRDDELRIVIRKAKRILSTLLVIDKEGNYKKLTGALFSLIGNMYYILGEFRASTGYFMKALSYGKNDITNWVEFMFSLRANGNIDVFEDLIFNLQGVYEAWRDDKETEMTQEKVYELIRLAKHEAESSHVVRER